MEQSFVLRVHGHLSIFEQMFMTAEERKWWVDRLVKENERQEQAAKGKTSLPGKLPESPGQPPV